MDYKEKRTKVQMIVLKLFREELNENALVVDRTHRIRKKRDSSSNPRPVIVKLASYNIRIKVFKGTLMQI